MAKIKLKKYLPVGIAIAAGALLLYYSRKASAAPVAPLPVVPPVEVLPPTEDPKPTGAKKVDAPSFPFSLPEAKAAEAAQATAEHAEWFALMSNVMEQSGNPGPNPTDQDYVAARQQAGIPSRRTIPGFLTDEAFDVLYGANLRIPNKDDRGEGWQPFFDSWVRMQNILKGQTWVGR